jgi:hypothetical protein
VIPALRYLLAAVGKLSLFQFQLLSHGFQIASDLEVHFSHVWFRRPRGDFALPNMVDTRNPLSPSYGMVI